MLAARGRPVLLVAVLTVLAGWATAPSAPAAAGVLPSQPGNGRVLDPVGRLTTVGGFPRGGALTRDGRFFWAVDAGRGPNAVRVVDVASGAVVQTLPIPGGSVGIAFAPDGRHAYVSGEPAEGPQPPEAKAPQGNVVHVYAVDAAGRATEEAPIALPQTRDGAAASDELPPASGVQAWPQGLDVTPDGRRLVVALGQADQAALIDLASRKTTLVDVGRYPYTAVVDPHRPRAYVSNERDGTVSAIDLDTAKVVATIAVGGPRGADYAHAEGMSADPVADRLYVAVTDRDLVGVIDTAKLRLERTVDVGRPAGIGTAPVATAVAPDGQTLYVADAGEDAVVGIALTDRPTGAVREGLTRRVRSVASIGRYRRSIAAARRARRRAGGGPAARRRFAHRATVLRRALLVGALVRGCGGPRRPQDAAYGTAVLRAYARRDAAPRRGAAHRRALRAFRVAVARARRRLPALQPCPPPGYVKGAKAFSVLGRLPTAAYPSAVAVTDDRLVWLAAKGLGTGPNPAGESIKLLTTGRVGVLDRPSDKVLAQLTGRADREVVPANAQQPPAGTPLIGPGGGPSDKIKHVFYVVKENRTYDQIYGSDPRGRGDARNELFDDNGVPGPTGGVTPNAHALSRRFGLYDNVYANSEESTAGHKITAGGYANDYTQRYTFANRGRKGNPDIFAIGIPPNAFVFDQAVRQGVSQRIYGELGGGNQPFSNDGRPTFQGVQDATDPSYPSQIQGTCAPAFPVPAGTPLPARCTTDAGDVGATHGAPATASRIRSFAAQFAGQDAAGTVPAFNYLILFNDHTNGTDPGLYSPKADLADNDLALGQLVDLVSHSSVWKDSAILVVEDDSQDGIDSVDAHRMPVQVISPWARTGGQVVSTRYDHYSFLRTAELILGLKPLSINDALATPLYDAFISGNAKPDVEGTRYTAIQPQQSLTEVNPPNAPNARLSAALPWGQTDLVPQRLSDRILWQSVFGAGSTVPPSGPGASEDEAARTTTALAAYRSGRSVQRALAAVSEGSDDPARERVERALRSVGGG